MNPIKQAAQVTLYKRLDYSNQISYLIIYYSINDSVATHDCLTIDVCSPATTKLA